MALFFDYPDAPEAEFGYWGPVTSTIDWCEENYLFSPYIAEMINSLTNIAFVLLAMHNLYTVVQNNHGWLYIFTCIGFAFVGVGSFLFHMSLLYEYQLMDELPMVYVTALPFGYLMGYDKSPSIRTVWKVGTFVTTLLFTYIYIFVWRNPVFHQIFYAILNFGIIFKSLGAIHRLVTDEKVRRLEYKLMILAFGLFGLGFFIWNIDNIYCSSITSFRRSVLGLPLGLLTEGHGWWHIFTGLGIYYFILYNQVLSTWISGKQDDYQLVWYGPFAEVKLRAIPRKKVE
ncbi:DEKNAAC100706 [Brettanomyces naardenensis]|uniref:DEKNAAC100706 n=1 Tax=Brettanomyces naardenensis TaxID=13370 RepID=A0A448YFZ4_BRENA|nr:DEKNAAC100706 [Brettanomyces naardenensis]